MHARLVSACMCDQRQILKSEESIRWGVQLASGSALQPATLLCGEKRRNPTATHLFFHRFWAVCASQGCQGFRGGVTVTITASVGQQARHQVAPKISGLWQVRPPPLAMKILLRSGRKFIHIVEVTFSFEDQYYTAKSNWYIPSVLVISSLFVPE